MWRLIIGQAAEKKPLLLWRSVLMFRNQWNKIIRHLILSTFQGLGNITVEEKNVVRAGGNVGLF